jgi:hypothetical protein
MMPSTLFTRTPVAVPFGGAVRMTNLDLLLSAVIALGLPFAAAWLLDLTGGALTALVLYYAVCCVAVVRWRKGTLDYRWPACWPWSMFAMSLLVPAAITAINWRALPDYGAPLLGVVLTAVVWGTLNAAMEQLAWLYVLDAWRNRWTKGPLRWVGLAVGIVLLLVLVGLIHVVFWIRFLPKGQDTPRSWATVPLNMLLTVSYALLYYRSRSMWPTFFVHLLADLQLVLLANYSIVPYL